MANTQVDPFYMKALESFKEAVDVKSLKEAPMDSFNYYKRTIISCIITTILGALIGAGISLILLKGGI